MPDLDRIYRDIDDNSFGLTEINFSNRRLYGLGRTFNILYERTFAFLGDSHTVGAGSAGGMSWVNLAMRMAGSALISSNSVNAGVAGDNSTQILSRYDSAIRNRPDLVKIGSVICLMGTNNIIQNIPLTTFANDVKQLHLKTVEDGISLILCTVPPLGTTNPTSPTPSVSTPQNRALTLQYNLFLKAYCAMHNIPIAEVNAALTLKSGASAGQVDPLYISGGTDNVHFTNYGHVAIAKAVTAVVNTMFTAPHLVDHISGASSNIGANLIANPTFAVDTSSWLEQSGGTGSAATLSAVADATGKLKYGRWLQADWNATTGGFKNIRSSSISFASNGIVAGDKLLITARRDYEDVEGNYEFNAAPASKPCAFGLYIMDSSFNQIAILDDSAVAKPGPVSTIFTVPSGMTGLIISMFIKLNAERNVKFKIGEVGVFKVSGLTDIMSLL
jgi:lysophospholipase L1-like esterase